METPRRVNEIIRQHYYYNLGLLYFLQNDPEVPPHIRQDASRWGLCKDEFVETAGVSATVVYS